LVDTAGGGSDDNAVTAAVSGFIGRTLMDNADVLCAPVSPLLQHVPL